MICCFSQVFWTKNGQGGGGSTCTNTPKRELGSRWPTSPTGAGQAENMCRIAVKRDTGFRTIHQKSPPMPERSGMGGLSILEPPAVYILMNGAKSGIPFNGN